MNLIKFLFTKNYPDAPKSELIPKSPPLTFELKNELIENERIRMPNGSYGKYTLMDKLHIADNIIIQIHKSVYSGVVTMITLKGVGCTTDAGYKFVKWSNVYSKKFIV